MERIQALREGVQETKEMAIDNLDKLVNNRQRELDSLSEITEGLVISAKDYEKVAKKTNWQTKLAQAKLWIIVCCILVAIVIVAGAIALAVGFGVS